MYPRVLRLSVTLMHPAKAVGRNEMPFGRDTHVASSNIVLDGGPGSPMGRGDMGIGTLIASISQSPGTVISLLVFARCQHLCVGDAVCR